MIKAYQLYTGPDDHSYFRTGYVKENIVTEAKLVQFKETPGGSSYDWHPAPTEQYVLTLTGTLEFTTSKGDVFILRPGDVLIATDTSGKGHKWKILGTDPWKRAYLPFTPGIEINFFLEDD